MRRFLCSLIILTVAGSWSAAQDKLDRDKLLFYTDGVG